MEQSVKSEEQPSAPQQQPNADSQNDGPPDDIDAGQQNDISDTSSHSDSAAVIVPDDSCILFGRGKGTNNRPANRRMRSIIDRYRDQYHAAERGEKCKLVRKVHDELVERGMKFLKQVEGETTWVEVDTDVSILKVGHALRSTKQDKRQKESVRPGQPSVSNNPPLAQEVQEAHVALHGGQIQASATALAEANLFAHRGLVGMPLPLGSNLMWDSALGVTGGPGFAALGASHHPLLSLDRSHPMEMMINRLRSVVPMSLGVAPAPRGNMSGFSTNELLLLIEREQRLRQMLLNDAPTWPRQFPGAPP